VRSVFGQDGWVDELGSHTVLNTKPTTDYNNYSTTSYGAQGGANGGGFMLGSQNESPSTKRTYGKDTLRPVTIRQLIEAHHPHPDADYFMIDNSEATQVTFVGQVRNISQQATNVTYKLDDGTGVMEVKVWIDAEAVEEKKDKVAEQGYARVWGRLKAFNNKRHVGAQIIRPIPDFNEIQYHLLEATAVHLHFSRGPPESLQQNGAGAGAGKAGGVANGEGQANGGGYGGGAENGGGVKQLPPSASRAARVVYQTLAETPQTHEGLHMQDIATRCGLEITEVMKGGDELANMGMIYTTVDDYTWAVLDV